jgi:hypothetical protein
LKQWSNAPLADNSLNILISGVEHLHPSQQALDYSEHLSEIHSTFLEYSITGVSCSFCHNLPENDGTLNGPQFRSLLTQSPLFKEGEEVSLVDYIEKWVGGGDGEHLMKSFINGIFKPNKRLLDVLDAVIKRDEQWHLLDEQRIDFSSPCLSYAFHLLRVSRSKRRLRGKTQKKSQNYLRNSLNRVTASSVREGRPR